MKDEEFIKINGFSIDKLSLTERLRSMGLIGIDKVVSGKKRKSFWRRRFWK